MTKINPEENPTSKWISYRPELKILDCTIRDGGLMNNHLFDDEVVPYASYEIVSNYKL